MAQGIDTVDVFAVFTFLPDESARTRGLSPEHWMLPRRTRILKQWLYIQCFSINFRRPWWKECIVLYAVLYYGLELGARLQEIFADSRPVEFAVLHFALDLCRHGALGTRIANGLLRLFLSVAGLRTRVWKHHMPNLWSCRVVSSSTAYALSNNWSLAIAAFVVPSFGPKSFSSNDAGHDFSRGFGATNAEVVSVVLRHSFAESTRRSCRHTPMRGGAGTEIPAIPVGRVSTVAIDLNIDIPEGLEIRDGAAYRPYLTVGGGPCGVHALFGKLQEIGYFVNNARGLAQQLLGSTLEEVRNKIEESGRANLEIVEDSLWSELMLPFLRDKRDPEIKIFADVFRPRHPARFAELRELVRMDANRVTEHDRLKGVAGERLRTLCNERTEPMRRTIAVNIGFIPCLDCSLKDTSLETLRPLLATGADEMYDFIARPGFGANMRLNFTWLARKKRSPNTAPAINMPLYSTNVLSSTDCVGLLQSDRTRARRCKLL